MTHTQIIEGYFAGRRGVMVRVNSSPFSGDELIEGSIVEIMDDDQMVMVFVDDHHDPRVMEFYDDELERFVD